MTNCTLDLMAKEDDKVYASANHRVIGSSSFIFALRMLLSATCFVKFEKLIYCEVRKVRI